MNRVTYYYSIDLKRNTVRKCMLGVIKGETLSRRIQVALNSKGLPYLIPNNYSARMYVKKANGTTSVNACTINNNLITYDILGSDCDVSGVVTFQLKVQDVSGILMTSVFEAEVETGIADDSAVPSQARYTALDYEIQRLQATNDTAIELNGDITRSLARETDILNKASSAVLSATLAKASELNAKTSEINAKGSEDNARYYANSIHDDVLAINRKLGFAEFDIDSNGNLVYTDNSPYTFGVSENGDLTWEVENE